MTRDTKLRLEGYAIMAAMAILTAPAWLFAARLWWSWVHALLTKPWVEIFCIGKGCLI